MDEIIDLKHYTRTKDLDYTFKVCSAITAIIPVGKYQTIHLDGFSRRFWVSGILTDVVSHHTSLPFKVGDKVCVWYRFIITGGCKRAWITGIQDMNRQSISDLL